MTDKEYRGKAKSKDLSLGGCLYLVPEHTTSRAGSVMSWQLSTYITLMVGQTNPATPIYEAFRDEIEDYNCNIQDYLSEIDEWLAGNNDLIKSKAIILKEFEPIAIYA